MIRTFISFDYDNDRELRDTLIGQAKLQDSPFSIADYSLNAPLTEKWRVEARYRIRRADLTIVICEEHTDTAKGVAAELTITQEEEKPYFLLWDRPNKTCKRPAMAKNSDKIYDWKWKILKNLIAGAR